MRKRWLAIVVFGLSALLGAEPLERDRIVARAAVQDAVLASLAGYVANPRYGVSGATFSAEPLPATLTFRATPLDALLPALPPAVPDDAPLFRRLQAASRGPLDDLARSHLEVHAWRDGDAVLDGTVGTRWPEGWTVALLVVRFATGSFDPIRVDVDVRVRGKRLVSAVRLTGFALLTPDGLSMDQVAVRELGGMDEDGEGR